MKKLKWIGIIVGCFFTLGIIGMLLGVEPIEFESKAEQPEKAEVDVEEKEKEEPKEIVSKPVESEEKEVEAPAETKVKEVETKKPNKEEKTADPIIAEKEYYLNEVKPNIQDQLNLFDAAWNELWKPTFEGASKGTINTYDAYSNMKKTESHYDLLYSTLGEIEGKDLSKENKKLLKEFRVNIQSAARWREEAAKQAKNMFDDKDYSPSRLEKVQEYVKTADNKMLSAVVSLSTLESNLDIMGIRNK